MKCLKSIVLVYCCCVILKSFANNTQSTELVNTINSIMSHKSWNTVVHQTKILIDGNPTTIISYLNDNLEYDAKATVIQLNESNVLEVLNLVYTAFKCEYASFVRDLLKFFFEYISSCQTLVMDSVRQPVDTVAEDACSYRIIIDRFINFKQNIVRIIFNLFNFMDLSQHLKLSDQTLLKSLVSINLFLYHHQHFTNIDNSTAQSHDEISPATDANDTQYQDNPQIDHMVVLKKVVVQMKDLVEYFRCKNCYVGYDYFNDSKTNNVKISTSIHQLYDTYLSTSKINYFNDIGIQHGLYDVEMYDPKYLLVENLFEIENFPGQIIHKVGTGTEYTLQSFYKDTRMSYNIEVILHYQNILIESINILFFRKFQNLLNGNVNLKIENMERLLNAFNDYINKMIPETILSDDYKLLVEIRDSMTASSSDSVELQKILQLLNKNSSVDLLDTSAVNDFINGISMADFLQKIMDSKHFKCFLQIFELLKRGWHTNYDYNLLTVDAHEQLENRVDGDPDSAATCKSTGVLRVILVSISRLVNVMVKHEVCSRGDNTTAEEQCFQDSLRSHLNCVFSCVVDLIENTNDGTLHQLLLPVLFHLENSGWIYHGANDVEACTQHVAVHQCLLMTLGSVERYELNNCKSPKYNQTIYDKMIVDYADVKSSDITAVDVVSELRARIALKTLKYSDDEGKIKTYNFIDDNVDTNMFSEFLRYAPGVYSNNYQFYWYGRKKNIYNIIQAVVQNVIDYHDIVRYQLIIIQWYIYKLYIRMNFFLKCRLVKEQFTMIQNELLEIQQFDFPQAEKIDFSDTIRIYFDILNDETMSDLKMENFNNLIKKKIELFNIDAIELELKADNSCCSRSLKRYFEITKLSFRTIEHNLL